MEKNTSFSKWRQRLWPIRLSDLPKFLPLLFIKFFISFNFSILLSLKDTFILTEKGSGAEVIPVLKGWIVLPVALIATACYAKLSNRFRRSSLFYGTLTCFLGFFLAYAFILYPNKEALSPHASADWLTQILGVKYQPWIAVYRNWMQTLFFVMAELWGSIGFFLLFWGFVNQINTIQEAKRYYTLFVAAGDVAAVLAGPLVWLYAQKFAHTEFTFTLQALTLFMTFFGLVVMFLHYWLTHRVLTLPQFLPPSSESSQIDSKTKLSLLEGLKKIAYSKPLRCLAIMVISYGLAINLIEVSWKANLKMAYPSAADYQSFMGKLTFIVGLASLIIAFFFSGNIIRVLGWYFSSQITPIVVGGTGLCFLFFLLFQAPLQSLLSHWGISSLSWIVLFGAFQNVLSKVMKYCFFDPTKEMAFIPLDQESKVKGKAAVDVVGSRLGKSGSSWIQIVLIMFSHTGSVLSITPLLIPFVTFTTLYWMYAVKTLHKDRMKEGEEETVASEAPDVVP